jgi:hypothetical protein
MRGPRCQSRKQIIGSPPVIRNVSKYSRPIALDLCIVEIHARSPLLRGARSSSATTPTLHFFGRGSKNAKWERINIEFDASVVTRPVDWSSIRLDPIRSSGMEGESPQQRTDISNQSDDKQFRSIALPLSSSFGPNSSLHIFLSELPFICAS